MYNAFYSNTHLFINFTIQQQNQVGAKDVHTLRVLRTTTSAATISLNV